MKTIRQLKGRARIHEEKTDFIILGAGFVGSVTAMCLVQKGYSVTIIDKGHHPRFSIGESTTPELNIRLRQLGRQYDLWELVAISSFFRLRKSGIPVNFTPKESFYFVHHEKNEPIDPDNEIFQQTSPWPSGPDVHYQRDKMDEFLLTRAVARGAQYFPDSETGRITTTAQAVNVELKAQRKNLRIQGKMILDCSGIQSPLAAQFNLRKGAPKPFLNSRAIFTHMQRLAPLDDIVNVKKTLGRNATTQHHISRHSWLWIIPLSDDLVSVGLVRNTDYFPYTGKAPEQEFEEYIKDYPDLGKIFQNACTVRPWTSLPKLQYRSGQLAGDRFLLFPTVAGFIDPLLSTGLAMNITALTKFLAAIDEMVKTNDFSRAILAPLEERIQTEIRFLDMYMHSLFISFGNIRLFAAVFNVFRLGILLEMSGLDDRALPVSLWHTENTDFQNLLQKVHAYLLSIEHHPEFASLQDQDLREIIRKNDPFHFGTRRIGQIQSEYPVSLIQLVPWILRRKSYRTLLFSASTFRNMIVVLRRYFENPARDTRRNIWGAIRWRSIRNLFRILQLRPVNKDNKVKRESD